VCRFWNRGYDVVERIAVKRLTASDCTLFEAVFRKIGAGNQKSINLNADVLTGQLYPDLAAAAAMTDNQIPLPLVLYGPNAKDAHKITRKIIKNSTYKNWRLNGEFIYGPPDDPNRYDGVKPGDLAVMVFRGWPVPLGIDLILVSQTEPTDVALHKMLAPLLGNKSMVAVSPAQIAGAANEAAISVQHPVYVAAADPEMDAALEDAAQGGAAGIGRLLRNTSKRRVSGAELARAKARAEKTGQDGEGLVNGYLATKMAVGALKTFRWVSVDNAVSPYDFEMIGPSGQLTLLDVKTTCGPFDNVIHLSLAEIVEASGTVPYSVFRVFELDEEGGKLRCSDDIRPLAQRLKAIHEAHMPAGVRVDGFSVATSALEWGDEKYLKRQEDEAPGHDCD
jgi:hypothetical protein